MTCMHGCGSYICLELLQAIYIKTFGCAHNQVRLSYARGCMPKPMLADSILNIEDHCAAGN